MEVLLWTLDSSNTIIDDFQRERVQALDGRTDQEPMYWYENNGGIVYLNPAVTRRLKDLENHCNGLGVLSNSY
jgi:hypothetical protein